MSTSRRRFLRTGLFATLFAAVPLKDVLAQSWKQSDGNPINTLPVQGDSLFDYSEATFRSYLNSVFQMHTTAGIVAVTLMSVDDMPAAKGGECFSLSFRGGSIPQCQDTYTLIHPALGTFQLLLVPGSADANGAQGYVATINHLSLADVANISPPSRVRSTTPSGAAAASPAATNSPATTNPSIIQFTTPAAAPAVFASPAQSQPRRPKLGRKRSKDVNLLM